MNLPESWTEVTSTSPLLLAFLVLVGASLIIFFLAPFFFKLIRKAKFPQQLLFIKRHPKRSLAAVLVVLIAVFGAYVFYYFNQPVRIVTAAQLKLEKGGALGLTQKGPLGRSEAGLYFLDIRSRSEYAVDHLKESVSVPAERAINLRPNDQSDIVIYSTGSRFNEAVKVADALRKRAEKSGKIYVIRDGFEGLKKAGLVTETGGWD